jgi:Family of unknown function (DUF6062)
MQSQHRTRYACFYKKPHQNLSGEPSVTRTQTFFELKERFEAIGQKPEKAHCPICTLTVEGVNRYLGALSYEGISDPAEFSKLQASAGFCNRHTQAWQKLNDAVGTAFIYKSVAKLFSEKLNNPPNKDFLDNLFNKRKNAPLAPGRQKREDLQLATCAACTIQEALELRILEEFVNGVKDAKFWAAYHTSKGICQPHLTGALERLPENLKEKVSAFEAEKWQELANELEVFIVKSNFDPNKGQITYEAEVHALKNAVWKSVGSAELN